MPHFSDRWVVALATATALGAWIGITTARSLAAAGGGQAMAAGGWGPVLVALAAAGVALVARRPVVLCLALAVLAATLAQRSIDGLHPPHLGAVRAEVTLLGGPAPTAGGGVRADVRFDGKRLAASAQRAAAATLDDRLAGERVLVVGTITRPGPYEQRMLHRHLAGRLRIDTVAGWRTGGAVSRAANGLRRTLEAGARSLAPRPRALLMGLVLGDDRAQPADLTDAFQAAGLAHLTAVSGQNVSFMLLLVHPLLVRMRFAPRLLAALAVLGGFALLTRFEPSVLRATAMAAIGAFSAAVGRPTSGLRRLSLAVVGLLLVDPLLVSSLGFRLSVAGAAGIIVAARPIERSLPGPRWLAAPLAVTGAAQLAVAPLLVQSFGAVSLVSLPANLLAVPAAGPVMMWGLTAGVAAGALGGSAATLLHVPSRLLLAWIEVVALTAASRPLGLLRASHIAALFAAIVLAALARHLLRRSTRRLLADRGEGGSRSGSSSDPGPPPEVRMASALRWAGVVVTVAVLATAIAGGRPPGPSGASPTPLGPGAELWRTDGAAVAIIDGRTTVEDLLSGVRASGVDRLDVLVVRTTADRAQGVAARARERWPALVVLAPRTVGGLAAAVTPPPHSEMDVGSLHLRFGTTTDRLELTIGPKAPAGRSP
jgi:competence protein ComEC